MLVAILVALCIDRKDTEAPTEASRAHPRGEPPEGILDSLQSQSLLGQSAVNGLSKHPLD